MMTPARRRPAARSQRGFSLLEVMVAMVVMAILTVVVTSSLGGVMRWYGKSMTTHRLTQLQDGMSQAYAENMAIAEADTNSEIALADGVISESTTSAGQRCSTTASTFSAASPFLDMSTSAAYLDGFNRPLCVFVTPQQTTTMSGVTLYYHSIAIVGMGASGYLNSGTTFSSDGTLTLGGDNQGIVIDGRTIAARQFADTRARMMKITQAVESYFLGRFQAGTSPSTMIDYFGTSSGSSTWDTEGSMPITGGAAMNTDASYYQPLGLSVDDVTDPYGQSFYFDNASSAVRSPSNGSASMNSTPPWSARVYTTLPGNVAYVQSAIGTY